jgi:cytochrome oxidase assembly protein ShyY1
MSKKKDMWPKKINSWNDWKRNILANVEASQNAPPIKFPKVKKKK